jgi:hypothetical protein
MAQPKAGFANSGHRNRLLFRTWAEPARTQPMKRCSMKRKSKGSSPVVKIEKRDAGGWFPDLS